MEHYPFPTDPQHQEKLFWLALEAIQDGIWDWYPETDQVIWSDRTYTMLGYKPQEFRVNFEKWRSLLHPDDREAATAEVSRGLADPEKSFSIEFRFKNQKGQYQWINGRGRVVSQNEKGEITRVVGTHTEITDRKKAQEELRRIEWMLDPNTLAHFPEEPQLWEEPSYGRLDVLNQEGSILLCIGKELLKNISFDYLRLLGTSTAIYESNGDYALGLFSSNWCRFLDQASRDLCECTSNREAMDSGKWLCHESCWTEASKASINQRKAVEIECHGGLRIYAIPIFAGSNVIGSINVGYGDPPSDEQTLAQIAQKYRIDPDDLRKLAMDYESRPPFIIEMAKQRLELSSRLIGEIVERKLAERSLRESLEDLHLAQQMADIGNWKWVDKEARLEWSEQVFSIFSIPIEQPSPGFEILQDYLDPGSYRAFIQAFEEGRKQGKAFNMAIRTQFPTQKWIRAIAKSESGASPESFSLRGTFQDITLRMRNEQKIRKMNEELEEKVRLRTKELEIRQKELARNELSLRRMVDHLNEQSEELRNRTNQLMEANRELEAFAYSVSHDLRAPLRAIDGFAKILEEDHFASLNPQGQETCRVIGENATRMGQLIDDLLSFSRLGRAGLDKSLFHMEPLVRAALHESLLHEQESKLNLKIDPLPEVLADHSMMRQVWTNLISNSLKFSSKRADILIEIRHEQRDGMHLFHIKDKGVGFDMRYAGKLFGVFQRLHNQKEYPGTGVGLAIVQRIIQRHGGSIWAESVPDIGSCFTFTLPIHSEK